MWNLSYCEMETRHRTLLFARTQNYLLKRVKLVLIWNMSICMGMNFNFIIGNKEFYLHVEIPTPA